MPYIAWGGGNKNHNLSYQSVLHPDWEAVKDPTLTLNINLMVKNINLQLVSSFILKLKISWSCSQKVLFNIQNLSVLKLNNSYFCPSFAGVTLDFINLYTTHAYIHIHSVLFIKYLMSHLRVLISFPFIITTKIPLAFLKTPENPSISKPYH